MNKMSDFDFFRHIPISKILTLFSFCIPSKFMRVISAALSVTVCLPNNNVFVVYAISNNLNKKYKNLFTPNVVQIIKKQKLCIKCVHAQSNFRMCLNREYFGLEKYWF